MDLNNKNIEEIKLWIAEFHNIYKYNSSFYTKRDKQDILGSKKDRKCRFCGKTKPETTFKKDAHILPAFMGNIHVKSNYECDNCNLIFGRYENDLASFIGLRRFYLPSGSFEKSRKITFKLQNSNAEIYKSVRGIEVIDPNNEIFEYLEDGKTQRCKINKTSFVPLYVYKALVKIVLSLLNDDSINQFRKTLNFLITDKFDDDDMVRKFANLSVHSIGELHFEHPMVFTYNKRKELKEYEEKNDVIIPDKTFIIYFNQFCLQIFLPFDINDNYIYKRKNILFHLFPPILSEPKEISNMTLYSDYYHVYRNMASNIKVKNEKDEFYITNLVGPILREYTEKEHNEMIKKFNLRNSKLYNHDRY